MSKVTFKEIIGGSSLTSEEARVLMHSIVSGDISPAQVAGLLTAFAIRGLELELLDGFRRAALELAVPVDLGFSDLIDVCGTGGDGKSTFNISTTVAFVIAGAGYRVAKHGNAAVSSLCGSSNVLEELGIVLSSDPGHLKRSLERTGACFIHAPHFHPAFKRIAPIRQELAIRTVFNALGPLINPAQIAFRYSGVYGLELQRIYSYLLRRRGERFAVVHALDGYDEISLTGAARIVSDGGMWELNPQALGASRVLPGDISAPKTPAESAKLIELLLKEGAKRAVEDRALKAKLAVVLANSAVALWCFEGAKRELVHYLDIVRESVESGRAYGVLKGSREV
jgi:anthranilate phosphoribosyltransferase